MGLRSSIGGQLARAEALASGSDGKPIAKFDPSAYEGIRCKESRAYAPPPASKERESLDEQMEREGRYARCMGRLSPEELRVLDLLGEVMHRKEARQVVHAGDIAGWQREGWRLDPLSKHIEERVGLDPVECWEMVGIEASGRAPLRPRQVAVELGLPIARVYKLATSGRKKIREGSR